MTPALGGHGRVAAGLTIVTDGEGRRDARPERGSSADRNPEEEATDEATGLALPPQADVSSG